MFLLYFWSNKCSLGEHCEHNYVHNSLDWNLLQDFMNKKKNNNNKYNVWGISKEFLCCLANTVISSKGKFVKTNFERWLYKALPEKIAYKSLDIWSLYNVKYLQH